MSLPLELIGVWIGGPRTEQVPSSTAHQLAMPRGSDAKITLRLIDENAQPVALDLAGTDTIALRLGSSFNYACKSIAGVAGPEIGTYIFLLAPTDTRDQVVSRLVYDVWAKKGAAQQQVVEISYFVLSQTVPDA